MGVRGAGNGPASAAEPAGKPYPHGGWEDTEQCLTDPVPEDLLHELIAVIAGSQSVSMAHQQFLAVVLEDLLGSW